MPNIDLLKSILKKRSSIILSSLFLLIIPVSWWILLPYAEKIPDNFTYKADVFSVDNLYNESEKRFQGPVFSNSNFSYESKGIENGTLLIKNSFDVKKLNGEKIFLVERLYGINQKTGEHVNGKGDQNRKGFLFAPKDSKKEKYTYWHVNYNSPAEMVYQNTEVIAGLEVYHYLCHFKADQTENLHFLPGVPKTRGVELDIKLETWIDPKTGFLIKYEDYTTAWYYDIKTKKRIHPWNRFHNEYQKNSIIANVKKAQFQNLKLTLLKFYLPALSLFFALSIILVSYLKRTRHYRKLRPTWIFALILLTGWAISFIVYSHLSESYEQKYLITQEEKVLEIMNSIKNELAFNQQALENLRYYCKNSDQFSANEFSEIAHHWIQVSEGVHALEWIPRIKDSNRNLYEHKWQISGFPDFHFSEISNNGKTIIASKRPEYYPVYYVEPFEANKKAFGFDLASNPIRREAIELAVKSRDFVYTRPIKFIQDTENRKGFLIFNPVYDKKNNLLGCFLGAYKTKDLLNTAINRPNLLRNIPIEISDKTGKYPESLYTNTIHKAQKETAFKITKSLPIMNRVWELTFYPPPPPIATSNIITLLFGMVITILLATLIYKTLIDESKKLIALNAALQKKQIELKNKNKELEQFAYISSHDLQEPLYTVMSVVDLLETEYKEKLDENAKMYLDFISQATNRMSNLIKALLKYSRIGHDRELTTIDCNTILKNTQNDLYSIITETNTVIEVGELPIIKGYQTELGLIFQNLISNSIKFRNTEIAPKIIISAELEEGHWKFSITDNGIGIDPEHREKIFTIFQRLNPRSEYEGTGIGLAHCQKIVDLHGGTIWVNSKPKEGSTFYFTIPN